MRLSDEDVRTLQDAMVEGEVSESDRRSLFSFLDANNGQLFPEERRTKIKAFMDMPSPDLRRMAMALERDDGVIDEAEAQRLVTQAEQGGFDGADKFALESMRLAFQIDPRAERTLRQRSEKLSAKQVVNDAVADGELSDTEYKQQIRPALESTPRRWSSTADDVMKVRMGGSVSMSEQVRRDLDSRLLGRGFDVKNAKTAEEVDALHVSAPDTEFADLAAKMKLPDDRNLSIGVIDGGFDLDHPLVSDEIARNEGEIAGNGVDDDGNGLKDDHAGMNGMGLIRGRMARDQHDDLYTTGRLAHHGNQVSSIASRGTDRLKVIAAADADKGIASAIDYVVERGATVVNISQGLLTEEKSQAVLDAIDKHPDVTFVHSAGNNARDFDSSPTRNRLTGHQRPNLIHVAAADPDGAPLPSTDHGASAVHVAAQAKFFGATLAAGADPDTGLGGYQFAGKTSQGSPNVANTIAKMKLLAPSLGPETLRTMLVESANKEPAWEGKVASGGRIDHEFAMTWAAARELQSRGLTTAQIVSQLQLTGSEAQALRGRLEP